MVANYLEAKENETSLVDIFENAAVTCTKN